VLVGHSYGGVVITNAAGSLSDVRRLVYVNPFIPAHPETTNEAILAAAAG
jgi:pimeloyl-ACP methyl ester carboxylesterase